MLRKNLGLYGRHSDCQFAKQCRGLKLFEDRLIIVNCCHNVPCVHGAPVEAVLLFGLI